MPVQSPKPRAVEVVPRVAATMAQPLALREESVGVVRSEEVLGAVEPLVRRRQWPAFAAVVPMGPMGYG